MFGNKRKKNNFEEEKEEEGKNIEKDEEEKEERKKKKIEKEEEKEKEEEEIIDSKDNIIIEPIKENKDIENKEKQNNIEWNDNTSIENFLKIILKLPTFTEDDIQEELLKFNKQKIRTVGTLKKTIELRGIEKLEKYGITGGVITKLIEVLKKSEIDLKTIIEAIYKKEPSWKCINSFIKERKRGRLR